MAVNNLNTPGVGIQPSLIDAKGDLLVGTAADAISRLGVTGPTGSVLVTDAGETTGLKWQQAQNIVQIVTATTSTQASSSSTSYADTGLTATITPTSASNKILVFAVQQGIKKASSGGGTENSISIQLLRGATGLGVFAPFYHYTNSTASTINGTVAYNYLDAPNTTSATTYKTQYKAGQAGSLAFVQLDSAISNIVLMEVTP
jgi:hypothetical protein